MQLGGAAERFLALELFGLVLGLERYVIRFAQDAILAFAIEAGSPGDVRGQGTFFEGLADKGLQIGVEMPLVRVFQLLRQRREIFGLVGRCPLDTDASAVCEN